MGLIITLFAYSLPEPATISVLPPVLTDPLFTTKCAKFTPSLPSQNKVMSRERRLSNMLSMTYYTTSIYTYAKAFPAHDRGHKSRPAQLITLHTALKGKISRLLSEACDDGRNECHYLQQYVRLRTGNGCESFTCPSAKGPSLYTVVINSVVGQLCMGVGGWGAGGGG